MVVPGSRRLLGRVAPPLVGRGLGVDAETLRASLSGVERELGAVLVVGSPGAGDLRSLGLPNPLVLSRAAAPLPDDAVPLEGTPGSLPLTDGSLDAVVLLAGAWTADPFGAPLAEAARVLRPGGVLVVAGVDPSTVRGRAVRALRLLAGGTPSLLTPGEVVARVEAAGLDARVSRRRWTFTVAGVRRDGSANP